MNTPTNTKSKTSKPTAAQIAKYKARSKRIDALIAKRNIKNNKSLAMGLVPLIAQNTDIEWEIVSNYLQRNGKCLTDREKSDRRFYAEYPQFAPKKKGR